MNPNLLVIGDCSIDQYMHIDSPHIMGNQICFLHGSKIPVKDFHETLAGNACHVAIGAQKLGLQTSVYSEFGDDEQANKFIQEFKNYGIDTTLCNKNPGTKTNTHAIIVYDDDRTIFSYHEPRKYNLDFHKLPKPNWIYYTSLAHGFLDFQKKLLEYARENSDIGFAFNPGTIQLSEGANKLQEVLEVTNVLFANKQEANMLIGMRPGSKKSLQELHEELHKRGVSISLITDGANGSSCFDGDELIELPAPEVKGEVVDKTGAGDSYAAAFLAALHHKKPIRTAMEWGNKNAAHIVTCVGCIDGLLALEDMESKN